MIGAEITDNEAGHAARILGTDTATARGDVARTVAEARSLLRAREQSREPRDKYHERVARQAAALRETLRTLPGYALNEQWHHGLREAVPVPKELEPRTVSDVDELPLLLNTLERIEQAASKASEQRRHIGRTPETQARGIADLALRVFFRHNPQAQSPNPPHGAKAQADTFIQWIYDAAARRAGIDTGDGRDNASSHRKALWIKLTSQR